MNPKTLSKSEFAFYVGVSPAMVTRYARRGIPMTEDKRILVDEGAKWLEDLGFNVARNPVKRKPAKRKTARKAAKRKPVAKRKAAPTPESMEPIEYIEPIRLVEPSPRSRRVDGETKAGADTRNAIAIANHREVDLKVKLGKLVALSEMNAYIAGMIVNARDILLRMPGELRDRLALEKDPAKCEALIQVEVDRILASMAEYKNAA